MKFRVGDEVRVVGNATGISFDDTIGDICKVTKINKGVSGNNPHCLLSNNYWYKEEDIELVVDHDVLMQKVIERNNKSQPVHTIGDVLFGNPIEPEHYRKGEIDLFESAYRSRPFNEFRAIMEFVAERYMKRDKDNRIEDLDKAIYTLERLKEYEELEESE